MTATRSMAAPVRQRVAPRVLLMPALWLAILITLLSALVPQGLPASRSMGSAFSPATTTVALKASASQPVIESLRWTPPPLDPPVALLAAVIVLAGRAVATAVRMRPTREALAPISPGRWRQPRAPPRFLVAPSP